LPSPKSDPRAAETETVNVITPEGEPASLPIDVAAEAVRSAGYRYEDTDDALARLSHEGLEERYSGPVQGTRAVLAGVARGVSLGGSDALVRALGSEEQVEERRRLREFRPGLSIGGELGGALATALVSGGAGALGTAARATPVGAVTAIGARIARVAPEAGAITKIGRGAAGAFVEGGIQGAGTAVSDVALSKDPVTMDRLASAVSDRFIYGGAIGAGVGGGLRGLEVGLGAASKRLARARETSSKLDGVPDDLTGLDRKGLRGAEADEVARIEAERVPQRAQVATDINAFREATKVDQPWVAVATGGKRTKGAAAKGAADATPTTTGTILTDPARAPAAPPARPFAKPPTPITNRETGGFMRGFGQLDDEGARAAIKAWQLRTADDAAKLASDAAMPQLEQVIASGKVPRDVRLFRGVDTSVPLEGLRPGVVIARPGLLATSTTRETAETFATRGAPTADGIAGTVFEVDVRKGTPGAWASAKPGEREVLFGRNTPLRVKSVRMVDGVRYVEAEMLPARAAAAADDVARVSDDVFEVLDEADLLFDDAVDTTQKYPRWVREAEKVYLESDKFLDRILRNPKRLADDPKVALAALQQQEHALEMITQRADELRVFHAGDRTGRRAAALDRVPQTLEANRGLQQRITALASPPATPRLTAIKDAIDMLGASKAQTLGEQMAAGTAYGIVSDIVRRVPIIGGIAAPLVGARVADAIAGRMSGQLGAVTRAAAERTARAVDAFMDTTRKAERVAPVLASRVLANARFAPAAPVRPSKALAKPKAPTMEESFDQRVAELSSTVTLGPDGRPMVRPGVRAQIAQRLEPIAAFAPHVADQLETRAVRRLEFLALKMPKTVRLGMTKVKPSEMAIRAFARYVAAADDPGAIEERLAAGTITPEDAEVMRELYPDRMAEITRQIVERLATLRTSLPYHRRVALSIFTGAPVDAAMDPRILATLQAQFDQEERTEGGTQAPRPQPAFGSVQKSVPTPTPAQARGG